MLTDAIRIIKVLSQLQTLRPFVVAFVVTLAFWLMIERMWHDYRLDRYETITVFVLAVGFYYLGEWTARFVRKSLRSRRR